MIKTATPRRKSHVPTPQAPGYYIHLERLLDEMRAATQGQASVARELADVRARLAQAEGRLRLLESTSGT